MAPVAVRWTAEAVRDLEEIHTYIARNSPRYAAVVIGRLLEAIEQVRDFPDGGRVVPELQDPAVREVIHGAYRIVYERREDVLEVLTVFRASRLFPLQDR